MPLVMSKLEKAGKVNTNNIKLAVTVVLIEKISLGKPVNRLMSKKKKTQIRNNSIEFTQEQIESYVYKGNRDYKRIFNIRDEDDLVEYKQTLSNLNYGLS